MWRRRYEGDGNPNGTEKKTDELLEKSETRNGKYSIVSIVNIFFIAFVDTNAGAKKSLVGS